MSLGQTEQSVTTDPADSGGAARPTNGAKRPVDHKPVKRAKRRASTSQLKAVPETLAQREDMKAAAEAFAESIDKTRSLTKNELEAHGRTLLAERNEPEKFLGFIMVMIGNYFWRRQFLATPFERRLLLLPHCLKHAEGCPAEYDEFGLDCEKCGACSIADYKVRAEQLGYRVLVAEGSPIVLKIIISGYVDGILGVACLNVLEKAIDKVLIAGVPSYAVPLHSGDCKNTTMDEPWIWEVLDKYEPLPAPQTQSYLPVMRAAGELFSDLDRFQTLLPRMRTKTPEQARSPLGRTEHLAYDWLCQGGKRFRPFITLAAYDALSGQSASALGPGGEHASFPDGVGRVAMAIEAFHKASLVHDDIEDDDLYRYGSQTLHRLHGLGTAINVGDYLIGLGYKLVTAARKDIDAEAVADILDAMAQAHVKLCDGQGAEMAWQDEPEQELTPLDALQIYALKTSPAFEAALYAGLRMAGPADQYGEMIRQFSQQVGVGFQVLNDLADWRGDAHNKLVAGQDALSFRPTILLAFAFQAADAQQKETIRRAIRGEEPIGIRLGRLRRVFNEVKSFEKADALVEKCRDRAEQLADETEPEELRRLLYFFIDTVLAEPEDEEEAPTRSGSLVPLPVTTRS